jgi:lysophospholipase L1-like esterase
MNAPWEAPAADRQSPPWTGLPTAAPARRDDRGGWWAWLSVVAASTLGSALGWQTWLLHRAVVQGRGLAQQALPFESHPLAPRARVLLLGDSTGVGVGAGRPEGSLPGLLAAEFPAVQIVNRCQNGARVADTLQQLAPLAAAGERFDLVLLLVGGNDVMKLTSQQRLRVDAQALLQALQPLARCTVWMGSANIGGAPPIQRPWSWWLSWRTRRVMRLLAAQARAHGVLFIDFFRPLRRDLFARHAGTFFAEDGVHPSAMSYRFCFELLKRRAPLQALLERPTPELQTARARRG